MYRTARWSIMRGFILFGLASLLTILHAGSARAQWATNGDDISNTNTGNVGVGTAQPINRLHISFSEPSTVWGSDEANITLQNVNTANNNFAGVYFGSNRAAAHTLFIAGGISTQFISHADGSESGDLVFHTRGAGTMAERFRVTGSGSVGIGTTTPGTFLGGISGSGRMLHVVNPTDHAQLLLSTAGAGKLATINMEVGDATATKRVFQTRYEGASNAVRSFFFNESTGAVTQDNVLVLKNDGNIGIGTGTPGSKLDVSGDIHAATNIIANNTLGASNPSGTGTLFVAGTTLAQLGFNTTSPGQTKAIFFQDGGSTKANIQVNSSNNLELINWGANSIDFKTSNTSRLFVGAGGNVGVGTSTPATALHVVGDITVTGNINAKYQDVAEWVPSTQKLAVGTVVVVDAQGLNHVLASSTAYDTGVAGVITAQPGLILGEGGEGKVKVATTGRVKVKVNATRFPVRAGDLLVTSDVAGVAMRSEPVSVGGITMHRPGTIIGKALEPLEKGTGEILVLLSLQ